MHNVFRVLMRDLKRIAKAPASWVVILVLITLPSLYTWFNVVGFWNPYNNTGALKVCVVNEDEGAHNDLLGDLQLGDQIMDQLHENTQLNWEFTDYDDAMAKISSGEAYAAFVIPSDFSEDMTTLLTGEFQRPQLEYYVNEKLNPVAPKITDTGASTLDNTINDTFVSTVSSVVAETLNDKIAESQESFDASKAKVSTQIDKVDANLSDARESVSGLSTASSDAIAQANSAKASLSDARREIGDMALALSEASALAATLNTEIVSFSGNMSTAISGGLSTVLRLPRGRMPRWAMPQREFRRRRAMWNTRRALPRTSSMATRKSFPICKPWPMTPILLKTSAMPLTRPSLRCRRATPMPKRTSNR